MPGTQRLKIGGQEYEVPEENLEKLLEHLDKKGIAFGDADEGEQAAAADEGRMELGGPAAAKSTMTIGEPQVLKYGAEEAPTLDLANRPRVHIGNGDIATVNSVGITHDGREYLLPQVSKDGRMMDTDGAWDEFQRTGEHMGIYPDIKTSNSAGERIHQDQMNRPPHYTKDTNPDGSPYEDGGWLGKLAETGNDFSVGALKGATAGFDDELFGLAGYDPEDVRGIHEDAEKRSPIASRIGDVAGSLVLPVGRAAQGVKWGAKVGMAALNGALHGGLRGAGESEGEDLEQRAIDALAGAGVGGAVGGAVGGVAARIADGAQGTAKVLEKGADKARLGAYGATDDILAEQARRATAAARAAGDRTAYVTPEEAGRSLVQRGEALAPPNRLTPISSGEYAKRFSGQADALDTGVKNTIDEATARGARMPQDPRGQVAQSLYEQADDAVASAHGAGQGNALSGVARDIEQGQQQFTPHDLRAQKVGFDQNAFKGVSREDSLAGEANLAAGNEYRQMLSGLVGEGGDDLAEQYASQNAQLGTALTLRDSAAAQAKKAAAGGGWVPGLVGATGGAIAGGMLGGGLGVGAGAVAGYAARRGIAANASDLGANIARMGQGAFESGANGANWIAQQAPTAARQAASMYQDRQNDQRSESGPSGGETTLDEGRGQDAASAIQASPDVLGSYVSQFDLDDEQKVAAAYERLSRTDPEFRRTVAPQIQRLTANR